MAESPEVLVQRPCVGGVPLPVPQQLNAPMGLNLNYDLMAKTQIPNKSF